MSFSGAKPAAASVSPLTPEQVAMLREPLPKEAVSQRPDKKFLSSIKAIYVSERLNKVFGIGGWSISCARIVENDPASKMVVIEALLEIPAYGLSYTSFGGNNNEDRGDAYKGAVTDALTKIAAVYLEVGIDVFKGLQDGNGNMPAEKPALPPQSPLVREVNLLAAQVATDNELTPAEALKTASGFEKDGTSYYLTFEKLDTASEKWLKKTIAGLKALQGV